MVSADIRIYASWITLGYLDGSVEVRKRFRARQTCAYSRVSIDKVEEPVDNGKNIMTPFDGGFSFPKPEGNDDRGSHLGAVLTSGYLATTFSPNLVAYASLHASGQLTIQTMETDQSSPLITPVLAQRLTSALKKNGTFDDVALVVEKYLSDGKTALFFL